MTTAVGTLDELIEYLDGLDHRAPLGELVEHVARLDVTADDVADYIHFSSRHYMRNLLKAGEWYNIVVLCWKNGQRSPIHDHAGSSCAVKVLRGTATETLFDFAPNGLVRAIASRDLAAGGVTASQDSDMHQVSNLQADDADLVTLHVYSPPLYYMGTYSLTERGRGSEPMFVEFCEAGGI